MSYQPTAPVHHHLAPRSAQGELFARLPRQLPTFRADPTDDSLLAGYQLIPGDRHPR